MNNEMKFEKNGLLIPNGALEELGLSGICSAQNTVNPTPGSRILPAGC